MTAIVTLTMNPAIDMYLEADTFRTSGKIRCHVTGEGAGGGGVNVALAIGALGGAAEATAVVGGIAGERLLDLLDESDLTCHSIPIDGETRRSYVIFEQSSSDRYHFVTDGPELAADEWRRCLDAAVRAAEHADYLVMSGSLPLGVPDDFYARVAGEARSGTCRVVLDTSGPALAAALEEGVWLTKPNRREFDALAGRETSGFRERGEIARELVGRGAAEIMTATFGDEGTLLATAEDTVRVPAAPIEPQSQVGAGDSYVAGLILSLSRGHALKESVMYAAAAAGSALMRPGPGLCRLEETERLLESVRDATRDT